MLIERENSCLLVIDVQEKLTPFVLNHEKIVSQCAWLMRLAHELKVPCLVTEQYPQGLGQTVSSLRQLPAYQNPIHKVRFSSWGCVGFDEQLKDLNATHFVLVGIETHVCVLQTAIELLAQGFGVYVVVDAVSSRFELDYHFGLKRMKQAGAELVTSEMVFFEWIREAGTPEFKALSKAYLQHKES